MRTYVPVAPPPWNSKAELDAALERGDLRFAITLAEEVFWTSTQLLTVSSSIKNPIYTGGRVLDVIMEIWAISVIAALAGAMGSFLQKRGEELAEEH